MAQYTPENIIMKRAYFAEVTRTPFNGGFTVRASENTIHIFNSFMSFTPFTYNIVRFIRGQVTYRIKRRR